MWWIAAFLVFVGAVYWWRTETSGGTIPRALLRPQVDVCIRAQGGGGLGSLENDWAYAVTGAIAQFLAEERNVTRLATADLQTRVAVSVLTAQLLTPVAIEMGLSVPQLTVATSKFQYGALYDKQLRHDEKTPAKVLYSLILKVQQDYQGAAERSKVDAIRDSIQLVSGKPGDQFQSSRRMMAILFLAIYRSLDGASLSPQDRADIARLDNMAEWLGNSH
jgi:hypothetical protein